MIKPLAILLLSVTVSAAATTKHHDSSIGAPMYQDNPFTYLEGSFTNIEYVGTADHSGLVIRIQPRGTYMLFTEDILFCGSSVEKFFGKSNPMVLTYETVAHTTVEGLGCHRLISVDEVKPISGRETR